MNTWQSREVLLVCLNYDIQGYPNFSIFMVTPESLLNIDSESVGLGEA